jgi:hypothetical protein
VNGSFLPLIYRIYRASIGKRFSEVNAKGLLLGADLGYKGLEPEKGFTSGGENSLPKAGKVARRFSSGVKGPNPLPE